MAEKKKADKKKDDKVVKLKVVKKSKKKATIKKKKTERMLRVDFNQKERNELASDLARCYQEREQMIIDRKKIVKGLDAAITEKEAMISKLVTKVNDGYEHKGVPCEIVLDYKRNTKKITRLDTKKVIEEAAIPEDERQLEMGL